MGGKPEARFARTTFVAACSGTMGQPINTVVMAARAIVKVVAVEVVQMVVEVTDRVLLLEQCATCTTLNRMDGICTQGVHFARHGMVTSLTPAEASMNRLPFVDLLGLVAKLPMQVFKGKVLNCNLNLLHSFPGNGGPNLDVNVFENLDTDSRGYAHGHLTINITICRLW
ncbi:hypothetical protein Ancab_000994 [Ancistrocladus abbreviatus]